MAIFNIIKPFIGYIACFIAGAILAVCLFGTWPADRELESLRIESTAERYRIEGIIDQLRTSKARLGELEAVNRKFEAGFISIGKSLERLSEQTTDNLEKLRRIIGAIEEIQRTVGTLANL